MPGKYTCEKCGGSGKLEVFQHIEGGVCFKCGGDGKQEYPPDRRPRPTPTEPLLPRKEVRLLGRDWVIVKAPDNVFEVIPKTEVHPGVNPSLGMHPAFVILNGRVQMRISVGRTMGWGTPTAANVTGSGHAMDVILRQMYGRISEHDAREGTEMG